MSNPDSLLNDFMANLTQESGKAPETFLLSKKATAGELKQTIINVCNGYLNATKLSKEQVDMLKALLPYTVD